MSNFFRWWLERRDLFRSLLSFLPHSLLSPCHWRSLSRTTKTLFFLFHKTIKRGSWSSDFFFHPSHSLKFCLSHSLDFFSLVIDYFSFSDWQRLLLHSQLLIVTYRVVKDERFSSSLSLFHSHFLLLYFPFSLIFLYHFFVHNNHLSRSWWTRRFLLLKSSLSLFLYFFPPLLSPFRHTHIVNSHTEWTWEKKIHRMRSEEERERRQFIELYAIILDKLLLCFFFFLSLRSSLKHSLACNTKSFPLSHIPPCLVVKLFKTKNDFSRPIIIFGQE